ncbi:unnamed protein product [Calicophoron daubneyi]|uniref:Tetraspanin n=1 Tax=Calicophoron daubneyi TaxID=300641 RepID=A0AAV2TKN6_CALDB
MCHKVTCVLLCLFNAVVLVIGIAAIIAGAILKWNKSLFQKILDKYVEELVQKVNVDAREVVNEVIGKVQDMASSISTALLVFGIIMVVIAILAFVGACCHIKAILILYAVIIGALIVIHVIYLAVYFANRDIVLKYPMKVFEDMVYNYKSMSSNESDSLVLGALMQYYNCCGYSNGSDFNSPNSQFTHKDEYENQTITVEYPVPCCKVYGDWNDNQTCPVTFTESNSNIEVGCKDKFRHDLQLIMDLISKVSIVILVFNVIVFVLAILNIVLGDSC